MSDEACRHCGRDTAAGTSLFAGRVKILGDEVEYVCPTCLDEHPIQLADRVVLSKERLAAIERILPKGTGLN